MVQLLSAARVIPEAAGGMRPPLLMGLSKHQCQLCPLPPASHGLSHSGLCQMYIMSLPPYRTRSGHFSACRITYVGSSEKSPFLPTGSCRESRWRSLSAQKPLKGVLKANSQALNQLADNSVNTVAG